MSQDRESVGEEDKVTGRCSGRRIGHRGSRTREWECCVKDTKEG